jgi:hypothetical protein
MRSITTVSRAVGTKPPEARAHKVGITIPAPLLTFVDQLRVDLLSNNGIRADRGVVVCCAITTLQQSNDAGRDLLKYLAARSATEKASQSKSTGVRS